MAPRHEPSDESVPHALPDMDQAELREWSDSFREVARRGGERAAGRVLGAGVVGPSAGS